MYPEWMWQKTKDEEMDLEERLVNALTKRKFTITTAESCTGGMIAGTLVNVAGASDVLSEGYITYSNEAKERLVGVDRETLKSYGAVSEQTAKEMAEGAARAAGAEVALSATGIAGPGGGTAEKPVGLVYIGCCVCGRTNVVKFQFKGSRMQNRVSTVEEALKLALKEIEDL
ncbi:CinA family protein [Clostridium sp. C105KSO13]|uniref:CinA family protein n=1 Tax=Clostridium sp. C105KSO13 TaxID=1776045 RepID=UPI0007405D33|nr:CinA family protein [Clostridium sp. C105KSO13]CUX42295.1 Nicotinamide-nucleotide amidohydrolase PncC [Clostridium sp. C105KSO13]